MRATVLVLGALITAECQRTPPEDFGPRPPQASAGVSSSSLTTPALPAAPESARVLAVPSGAPGASATPSSSAAPHDGGAAVRADGRCVRATPPEAPPPVAPGPAPGCPPDPEKAAPRGPAARITFPGAGGVAVDAEVAVTERETERGLMYRKSMPEDRGMLFDLRTRADHTFWMHNTCIPLDLLYVDEDGLIVGIVENAPTLDDGLRSVGCLSRYVLEVNAGWSRRHGVTAGQQMRISRL